MINPSTSQSLRARVPSQHPCICDDYLGHPCAWCDMEASKKETPPRYEQLSFPFMQTEEL
jgi:hypothetical protein